MESPIGFTYGGLTDTVAQSTILGGFLNKDEFLYTTVANDNDEWIYLINKFSLEKKTVTPVMELYRFSTKAEGVPPAILSVVLSPDKKHLLLQDSLNGLTSYDLTNGTKKQLVSGSKLIKTDAYLNILKDQGIGLYGASRFQSDVEWIDLNTGTVRQPFAAEPGFIDIGVDRKGQVMYYNLTYDQASENLLKGDGQTLEISYGVQILDIQGNALKRFSLPKDSKERLEFGGYSESKKVVLLHKFIIASNNKGQFNKKTTGWFLGDMNTGSMTLLTKIDVPDSWDKKDIIFGNVTLDAAAVSAEEQVFVNFVETSYYSSRWKTKQVMLQEDEDIVMFADEPSKRVFISSLVRPDLVVAALRYKKYNWDNHEFSWLSGHWLARYHMQPEGDNIYFFQIN